MENLEVEELKAQIERLSQRISVLEVSRTENAAESESGGALDPSVPRNELVSVPNALHPFYVTCDGRETDPWLVYIPDGCCKYGDLTPDVIDPTPDATTHLADLQDDTKNGGIYAHLYLELDDDSDSESSTDQKVVGFPLLSIDTTPTQTPSEENIKVINVKIATITDGAVSQNISSALILGGSGGGETYTPDPSPFQFTTVSSEDPETHEQTLVGQISNCNFYWDGVLKTLSDFTPPATCTVYLCCTQAAPSSSGEAEWQFSIATSPAQATSGGRVVNYKLYDIASNKITMDYRTTFMELKSPHKVAKFVVERYDGEDGSIELDATIEGNPVAKVSGDGNNYARLYASSNSAAAKGLHVNSGSSQARLLANSTSAYLSLSGTQSSYVSIKGGQKSVLIDPSNLENGNEAKFHKLTVKHADPDTEDDIYDVLADKDITIHEGAAEERLTGVELELNGDTNLRLKLTFTDKDGNTRDEYSTGITLKQVDVVSDVSWSSPALIKSGKKVTVIGEESTGNQAVFTAVAHSSNT